MNNELEQLIQEAKKLKNIGKSDKEISEFIHIELGKLIIYDNNYSIGFEGYDINKKLEGKKSRISELRQEKILATQTSASSREQVCKGMAEIYTAILVELGINAKVVAVQSKEEVDGENREDGSIIDVPGIYRTSFNDNFEIQKGDYEKSNDSSIGHYYSIIKLDEGEFIQDFLTENALTRIKIGEAQKNISIPGFHRKEEHRERTISKNNKISNVYIEKIREELNEYVRGEDDFKVFEFIFEKLKEHIDKFGFEEAKDFIMMYASEIIPRGMIKMPPIPINLIKEDKTSCEVLCIYKYGEKNYLLKGGQTVKDLPVGEILNSEIQNIILHGFVPRKLNDAIHIRDIQIECIKENNYEINKLIQQVAEFRRKNKTPFEKDGKVDEQIIKIFELETKKCLELYKKEFANYQCQGREGVSLLEGNGQADCGGGVFGLQVTTGMQEFIDTRIKPVIRERGYSINKDGEVTYKTAANEFHEPILNIKNPQKYVGSTKDQMDYFAVLFAKNGMDIDWVVDAIPHEAMHTFGVSGGNAFLKEGIAEALIREICEKYGVYMMPTAHTQEAEFIRKLEMVVGREQVIESGMWSGKFKEKHFREIMANNPEIKFQKLSEIFELLKYELQKLEENKILQEELEEFSKEHPEIVHSLLQKVALYRKEDCTERYSSLAKTFDERLGLKCGSFFKYAEILENFYSLTSYNKTDPNFYRDVYSLSLDKLQDGYQLCNGKKLDDKSNRRLNRIGMLFEELSQENNLKISSFEDLMSPINEYVKGKSMDMNFGVSNDYTSIFAIQKAEMEEISKVLKVYEKTGSDNKYVLDKENIIKLAKNDSVVNEKENVKEVLHNEKNKETENLLTKYEKL